MSNSNGGEKQIKRRENKHIKLLATVIISSPSGTNGLSSRDSTGGLQPYIFVMESDM
jgi:hypothetical protein